METKELKTNLVSVKRQGKTTPNIKENQRTNLLDYHSLSNFEKIIKIKEGVSKSMLEEIKLKAGLDYDTISWILSVAKATIHNKKGEARFDQKVSEKIIVLGDLYSYGYSVFEDEEKFNAWMKSPNRTFGEKTPLQLTDTIYGMEEIKNAIARIEYGIYN
jgi:putative toxin-antitoxin system antitoxin component (TIGR02293 family)